MNPVDPTSGGDGGYAARQAVVRWAGRLFRREWRQQVLVLALVTVTVAAAVGGGSAAYNMVGIAEAAEFGNASHVIRFPATSSLDVRRALDAAGRTFGSTDAIATWAATVPGSVDSFEFRAFDPDGTFTAPLVAVRQGRYPRAMGEVALTEAIAAAFAATVGSTFAADGRQRLVVGIVENPKDLRDEFALVTPTEFGHAERVSLLLDTSTDAIRSFLGSGALPDRGVTVGSAAGSAGPFAAVAVLGFAQLALLLVALVAAAGFVIVAQRRLRQLGMLAAIGATERHLRLAVTANGTFIGSAGAALGTVIGLTGWVVTAPRIEHAVGYRIDADNVPWWMVLATAALAVATATAAAWWPARAVARVPVTAALTGRPPAPRPAQLSATPAVVLIVAGVVCLAAAGDIADEVTVHWSNVALGLAGVLSTAVGFLLLSPSAIKALAAAAERMPIAPRLALRDLARYRARSSAALAAITLTLGIACTIVIASASAEPTPGEGNLASDQVLVRAGDRDSPLVRDQTMAQTLEREEDTREVAAAFGGTTMTPLDVVFDPGVPPGPDGQQVITLARRVGGQLVDVAIVHLATPELLAVQGLDPRTLATNTDMITSQTGDLRLLGMIDDSGRFRPQPVGHVSRIPATFSSLPTAFVTPDSVHRRGFATARVGWLITTSSPPTADQIDEARHLAADADLTIETRREHHGLQALRGAATVTALLVALSIVGVTVGLIRSEGARDIRILTAAGADSAIRRAITATTAGGLVGLGAAVGLLGAYAGSAALHSDEIGSLTPIPLLPLATIVVLTPALAVAIGWFAGHEPSDLTRQPLD